MRTKFISQIVKELHLNIKVYRDYFCSNNKVYKEHCFAFIDYIFSTNDRLQIRQLYKFINELANNDDREYIYYFHQKYINRVCYMFFKEDGDTFKYFLDLDLK